MPATLGPSVASGEGLRASSAALPPPAAPPAPPPNPGAAAPLLALGVGGALGGASGARMATRIMIVPRATGVSSSSSASSSEPSLAPSSTIEPSGMLCEPRRPPAIFPAEGNTRWEPPFLSSIESRVLDWREGGFGVGGGAGSAGTPIISSSPCTSHVPASLDLPSRSRSLRDTLASAITPFVCPSLPRISRPILVHRHSWIHTCERFGSGSSRISLSSALRQRGRGGARRGEAQKQHSEECKCDRARVNGGQRRCDRASCTQSEGSCVSSRQHVHLSIGVIGQARGRVRVWVWASVHTSPSGRVRSCSAAQPTRCYAP